MERDDDMDYPILGLIALEERGDKFSPRAMANVWMKHMPVNLLYTAERAAYRNFVAGYWPPESATYRNPHREWIGAQIRADMFGYAAPGWPEKAAELAFRDASISHVKNGIYGEMFVAAMLAAAYVTDDIIEIINVGLSEIPANCRLAEAVHDTLGWCQELNDWEAVWDKIKERYGHYSGVHTINNAALVVLGLYFGNTDYENGIVISVRGDWVIDKSFARWEIHVKPDLAGTFEDGTGYSCKLSNVKAEGDKVAFDFVMDKGGFGIDIQFEGKVEGDRLNGVGMGNGFKTPMPIEAERA